MNRLSTRFASLVAALALLHAGQARADFTNWTYQWGSGPVVSGGTGNVSFVMGPSGDGTTLQPIQVASVTSTSTALGTAKSPADVYQAPNNTFDLKLTLKDNSNSTNGTLDFTGTLNGSLTQDPTSSLSLNWNNPSQTLNLSAHSFAVTMLQSPATVHGPGGPPTLLTANIAVSNTTGGGTNNGNGGGVATVPEPSGLVLGGLASTLGLGWWRRRARVAAA
jgi:hypothetical protein